VIILIGLSNIIYSQITISGIVTDENEQPLPGANVYIPEFEKGAITGLNGRFEIVDLPSAKFMIQVSYMGYKTYLENVTINTGFKDLGIKLQPSILTAKEVVISGGRHSTQHENAIKIELLKKKDLRQLKTPTLIEGLTYIPGVDMISKGYGVVTPVIRGLSTSNILLLNNGVRMENYQFSENHPYLVDETGLERVEVIKGPASLLYGSDAIGGVVNLVQEYLAPPQTITGDINLKYFSNTAGYSVAAGVQGTHNRLTWGMRGGVKSHKDYIDGHRELVPNTRFNGNTLKSYIGFRTSRSSHQLNYEYQKFRPALSNEESSNLVNIHTRDNEYWFQDLDHHLISLSSQWFSDPLKFMLKASYQQNFRRLFTVNPEQASVHMQLHTFLYESRINYKSSDISEFIFSIQGLSQKNINHEAPNKVLLDYYMNDIAVFGLSQHDFTNRMHLQLGFRFDNRFIKVPEQLKAGYNHQGDQEENLLLKFSKYYGNISSSIGLTYELAEGFLIRGNIASAYRSPNLAELIQDGIHGIRYEQGNRHLKSQRNYELDASAHFHREKIMLDLAWYYNFIDRYIFLSYTSDTTDGGFDIYRYVQNDAVLYGFEGLIEYVPIKWMNLRSSYNYLRGRQQSGGNLPFIPQNKLRFDIKLINSRMINKSKIYVNLGIEFADRQDYPSLFETVTDPYTLTHTGAGFSFPWSGQEVNIDIFVRNLFDVAYVDHLSTLKSLGYANMGRCIIASVHVPFSIHSIK